MIILVPLLLVLPRFLGLGGVWLANPISDALAFAITGAFLAAELRLLWRGDRRAGVPAVLPGAADPETSA